MQLLNLNQIMPAIPKKKQKNMVLYGRLWIANLSMKPKLGHWGEHILHTPELPASLFRI